MTIDTLISKAGSFSELLKYAEHAEPKFSFWRGTHICVSGYDGVAHVNDLAFRTKEMQGIANYAYTDSEREDGKRLAARIDILYDEIGKLFSEANLLAQLIEMVRVVSSAIFNYFFYGVRNPYHEWRGHETRNNSFEYYNRAQFVDTFHVSPEEAKKKNMIAGYISWPCPRWSVKAPQTAVPPMVTVLYQ